MDEEDDSQPDSARVFSVRIVDIDYYMAPPIPEIDICYSSFQGGKVNEVPVIRVFGSTPAGQKTCLHVHKALPYLYVPCSDIHLNSEVQHRDDEYKHIISHALEKSLKLKGKLGLTRQHVHACSLVRARKLYGYFPTEELFVKIYLYHPQDVARAANFLLGGAVLDKCLQPYEAHIPFILQFLVDYNLYGMGFIHLSKTKFRHPIPDTITQPSSCNRLSEKLNCSPPYFKADSQVWISSTVPVNWMWPAPEALSSSCDHTTKLMKRMSTCQLEGDSTTEDILNQHHKVFLSQSQTCSDVKMVQSLIPIWEEEYERTGLHNAYVDVPPDPGKPCQADVLKILALGSEMEKNIMELFRVAEGSINPMDKDLNFVQPTFFPSNMGKSDEHGSAALSISRTTPFEDSLDTTVLPGSTCNEHCSTSQDRVKDLLSSRTENVGTLTPKPSDEEILGVLKWLASSQAAEDINSDDEILRETILSPLLPAATINKVLEKANDDYESASQLECQDILNTIEAVNEVDKILYETIFSPLLPAATINKVLEKANDDYESASQLECQDNLNTIEAVNEVDYINENLELIGGIQTPLKDGIPQVDGSFVDHCCNPQSNSSSNFNFAEASHHYEELNKSRTTSKHKASMRWGALPLSMPGNVNDNHQDVSCNALSRSGSEATLSDPTRKNSNFNVLVNSNSSCPPEGILACCSLRDLMRKKRSYRVSSPECETNKAKRVFTKEEPNSNTFICTNIESLSHEGGHHDLKSLGSSDLKSPFTECHTSITEQHDMNSSTYGVNTVSKSAIDSARLLDGGTSNYEPSSECCVDHPFEQMGLRVPHPSSESPSDGKERHLCQHSEAEVIGKCIGKLSYETHQGTHVPVQIGSCSSASCRSFPALDVEGEPCDVHKLTPCDMPEQEEQGEVNSSDECPSQYVKDSYDETEGQNTYSSNHDAPSCFEEAFTDAPAHHCIDGSVVYMMTPASAPPTADSVRNWVFEFDSLAHSCEEKLHDARPYIGEPNKEDHGNKIMAVDAGCDEGKTVLVNEAENVKKVCTNVFQDFSQISGPYGNSKATPLSQTGFRDSASIGCGQRLTLLSLEILTESRGDLRPDPRYDAIKVLAFAVKDDNDSVASLYALLHTPENERNLDGLSSCNILHFNEERHMFNYMVDFILSLDPDVFMGWDIQGASLGFLIERASQLGIGLLNKISRTPLETKMDCNNLEGLEKIFHGDVRTEFGDGDSVLLDGGAIEDEWGRTHASGLHVDGRIVLNVWRLMRSEVKLTMYTVEAVAEAVLRRKVSLVNNKVLASWFSSGPSRARYRSIEFVVERAKLNLEIMDQLDMINRTSELARVFGIEFFSVLSRGSQYRVESMLLRLAHSQNYVAISPGSQQVATQPAMECLPLVMEPKSGFYADPVIVLDFQSLYPSMIIAYNLCFCTCLGKLAPPKTNILGVSSYSPEPHVLHKWKDQILFTPNGVMYVPPEVRKGVLPRLLDEILSTRIMVKQAMKKLDSSQKVLQRIFNSRQLALKLISNVTYGYTAAGFSGRMPCAELADSIVQCGRRTLETAISFVNANETWKAKVIYGDTDSLFVLLEGRSVEEAFRIGKEIAADVTRMNPDPVTLKMEKVYHPCFLLTKKRYVGYSYESPDQIDPVFDAKGIETVRRDTCGAVAKTMEQSLRLYFEHQDISKVKAYLQRQWKRIISGRVSFQDFIFAKEVRLGTYSTRNSSSIPPAAIVATKAMRVDPRAEPRYGERVPYIVVHGDPGARLVDMVVDPLDLLALDSPFRLNDQYYINKQIIPALQRVFGLVGADLSQWLSEIPRPIREAFGKRQLYNPNPYRARIDHYYISKHCILCGELAQSSKHLCENCSRNKTAMATTVIAKTSKLEKDMQHLVAVCRHCGGADWLVETGVKCTSLACSVFYERRKVQKELLSMSAVATETGLYPKCMAELF